MRNYQLPEFTISPDLRDHPKDQTAYFTFLKSVEKDLSTELSVNDRLAALEVYGVGSRVVGQLNSAELSLKVAIQICEREKYFSRLLQNKVRLAHVFQWKKNFDRSNDLFLECEKMLGPDISPGLTAAFWQHKGKNLFDQEFFELAAECFSMALEIRKQHGVPTDQIQSSEYALAQAQIRIEETNSDLPK